LEFGRNLVGPRDRGLPVIARPRGSHDNGRDDCGNAGDPGERFPFGRPAWLNPADALVYLYGEIGDGFGRSRPEHATGSLELSEQLTALAAVAEMFFDGGPHRSVEFLIQ
jgi:hypothetical protein